MNIEPSDYPTPDSPPPLAYGPPPPPPPHSRLGIASFVISAIFAIAIFVAFAYAGYLEATTPGGMDEESPEAIVVGLFVIFCSFGLIVGLGLGIAGLFTRQRRKVFPILGTILSALVLLGACGLVGIGLAMEAAAP